MDARSSFLRHCGCSVPHWSSELVWYRRQVDQREAVRWLCRAAEGGSAKAAAMLAGFLMTGNGLAYSPARAWALFMRAAKMGNENAAATAKILERQLPLQEKRVQRSLLRIKDSKTFLEKLIPRSER